MSLHAVYSAGSFPLKSLLAFRLVKSGCFASLGSIETGNFLFFSNTVHRPSFLLSPCDVCILCALIRCCLLPLHRSPPLPPSRIVCAAPADSSAAAASPASSLPVPSATMSHRGVAQLTRIDIGYSLQAGASKGVRAFVNSPLLTKFQQAHPHVQFHVAVNRKGLPHVDATYCQSHRQACDRRSGRRWRANASSER